MIGNTFFEDGIPKRIKNGRKQRMIKIKGINNKSASWRWIDYPKTSFITAA
jgi:hypothetical protein